MIFVVQKMAHDLANGCWASGAPYYVEASSKSALEQMLNQHIGGLYTWDVSPVTIVKQKELDALLSQERKLASGR